MIPCPKDMLMRQQAAKSHVTEPCEGGSEYVGVREMMVDPVCKNKHGRVDKVPTSKHTPAAYLERTVCYKALKGNLKMHFCIIVCLFII